MTLRDLGGEVKWRSGEVGSGEVGKKKTRIT